jgi:hypothetical protein
MQNEGGEGSRESLKGQHGVGALGAGVFQGEATSVGGNLSQSHK